MKRTAFEMELRTGGDERLYTRQTAENPARKKKRGQWMIVVQDTERVVMLIGFCGVVMC